MAEPSWFFRYIITYFFPYISNTNKVQCVRVSGGSPVVVWICGRSLHPHRSSLKLSLFPYFFHRFIYLFSFFLNFFPMSPSLPSHQKEPEHRLPYHLFNEVMVAHDRRGWHYSQEREREQCRGSYFFHTNFYKFSNKFSNSLKFSSKYFNPLFQNSFFQNSQLFTLNITVI